MNLKRIKSLRYVLMNSFENLYFSMVTEEQLANLRIEIARDAVRRMLSSLTESRVEQGGQSPTA